MSRFFPETRLEATDSDRRLGIPKYGRRGILGQAIAGLVLNGLLLSIFVTNFLAARAKAAAGM